MVPRLSLVLPAVVFAVAALVSSCSTSASSSPSSSDPIGDSGAPSVDADPERDAGSARGPLAASDYCESVVDFFCDFYLRCERMAAADTAECRAMFLETCNARYEPRYVDLERAKVLSLSRAGVDACAEHLSKVACVEQPFDLDGPCAGMWVGASAVGAPCGPDVESLVCAPGAACVLGLDLCGTCQAAVPRGEPCAQGVSRCAPSDACIEGVCVARALPGQACDEAKPCVVGSACTAGACVSPTTVGVGEDCDAKRRCAYGTVCDAGKCARAARLGEACSTSRACMSGRCEGGTCAPLRAAFAKCSAPTDCSSALCTDGSCASLPSACLSPP